MKLNKELAYLLGALRDATIDIREGKNYEIKIAQKNKEWLQLLQKLFKKYFKKEGKITTHINENWILRIGSKNIAKEITKISEMKIPQEFWNTPTIIKNSSISLQIAYLRGFFDAEGGLPKNPIESSQKYLSLSQKNKESLEFLRNILIKLKFKPTQLTICGKVWEFRITRKNNIIKFIELIGSWHPEKNKRLILLKKCLTSPNWRESTQGVEAAV